MGREGKLYEIWKEKREKRGRKGERRKEGGNEREKEEKKLMEIVSHVYCCLYLSLLFPSDAFVSLFPSFSES